MKKIDPEQVKVLQDLIDEIGTHNDNAYKLYAKLEEKGVNSEKLEQLSIVLSWNMLGIKVILSELAGISDELQISFKMGGINELLNHSIFYISYMLNEGELTDQDSRVEAELRALLGKFMRTADRIFGSQ